MGVSYRNVASVCCWGLLLYTEPRTGVLSQPAIAVTRYKYKGGRKNTEVRKIWKKQHISSDVPRASQGSPAVCSDPAFCQFAAQKWAEQKKTICTQTDEGWACPLCVPALLFPRGLCSISTPAGLWFPHTGCSVATSSSPVGMHWGNTSVWATSH